MRWVLTMGSTKERNVTVSNIYVHKVTNGPFYDEDEQMGWIVAVVSKTPEGEPYEDEVYSPSLDALYEIGRHCMKPRLEPFEVNLQ